jgi:hypothetical protein
MKSIVRTYRWQRVPVMGARNFPGYQEIATTTYLLNWFTNEIIARTHHCPCLHHVCLLAGWSKPTIIYAIGSSGAKEPVVPCEQWCRKSLSSMLSAMQAEQEGSSCGNRSQQSLIHLSNHHGHHISICAGRERIGSKYCWQQVEGFSTYGRD